MSRRRPVCVLVSVVLMAACRNAPPAAPTAPTPAAPPTTNVVAGRVLDLQANRALPGVQVTWRPSVSGSAQVSATTNADGIYRVTLPLTAQFEVTLSVGSNGGLRVLVPPSFYITDFLVNTGGCPTWYGVVLDASTRQPVSGATVAWGGVRSTTTTAGEYRLSVTCRPPVVGFPPSIGTSLLTVTHPEYVSLQELGPRSENIGAGPPGEMRRDLQLSRR